MGMSTKNEIKALLALLVSYWDIVGVMRDE
jgi:hypothetical protein